MRHVDWSLPEVRTAVALIQARASEIRREDPLMPPLAVIQAARSRCVPAVLEAIQAMDGSCDRPCDRNACAPVETLVKPWHMNPPHNGT